MLWRIVFGKVEFLSRDQLKTSLCLYFTFIFVVNECKTFIFIYTLDLIQSAGRSVSDFSSFVFSSQKEKSTFSSSDEEN